MTRNKLSFLLFFCILLLGKTLFAQIEETAEDKFRRGVIQAAVKAAKDGTIARRDVVKLRVAMLSPAFRERAYELAVVQMSASGSDAIGGENVPVDEEGKIVETAINWDNLLAFLEKLLPFILQLIDAFSSIDSIDVYANSGGNSLAVAA